MQADLSGVDPLDINLAQRNVLGDVITRTAHTFPSRTAIKADDGTRTYRELDDISNAIARGILDLGVRRQEPIAFLMGNSCGFVDAFFGCIKAGAVALPINLAQSPADISYVLTDAAAQTIIADAAFVPLLEQILPSLPLLTRVIVSGAEQLPELSAEVTDFDVLRRGDTAPLRVTIDDSDIVHCLYSSGTTSAPKGVLTRHSSVVTAILSTAIIIGHKWGDDHSVYPIILPLFHTTALDTLLLPILATGGTAIVFTGFEPLSYLKSLAEEKATHIMLLPNMYAILLGHEATEGLNFPDVRVAIYAMAPMPEARLKLLERLFPNAAAILGSGMTECVPPTVMQWPSHQAEKSGSWGAPVPSCEVQIVDADGDLLPRYETGEIVYRGPHVMRGYWNNTEANTATFRGGWMRTGDIGHIDDEGVVWFTDRAKDIVKSGGENVSSIEVERALLGNPAVLEAAVVGRADDRWGEAVTAVVVLNTDISEEELVAYCKEHLSGFKVPKRIEFVDELPKTATGKIQKHRLRVSS